MSTIQDYTTEYIEYCRFRKHLDVKTLKAYTIDLKQYTEFVARFVRESIGMEKSACTTEHVWGDRGSTLFSHADSTLTLQLSRSAIDHFITVLHKQYKPKTIKRKIASLKAFLHYMVYMGILDENPFNRLEVRFREPKLLPKTIPFYTIQKFLSTLYEQKNLAVSNYQKKCCLRDIAVIELLFATGMRISELCSLKPLDIDLKSHSVLIYGKGSKERILHLGNTSVISALRAYYQAFRHDIEACGYFFVNKRGNKLSDQSVRFMINRYADIAGIPQHLTPHMFRHSFATLMLEQDVDIRYIQQMLGHSSISTTEIYTHVSNAKQKYILSHKHPRKLMKINEG